MTGINTLSVCLRRKSKLIKLIISKDNMCCVSYRRESRIIFLCQVLIACHFPLSTSNYFNYEKKNNNNTWSDGQWLVHELSTVNY